MANAVQEDLECQRCLDLQQDSTVYITMSHEDEGVVTLLLECSEGHHWFEVESHDE